MSSPESDTSALSLRDHRLVLTNNCSAGHVCVGRPVRLRAAKLTRYRYVQLTTQEHWNLEPLTTENIIDIRAR